MPGGDLTAVARAQPGPALPRGGGTPREEPSTSSTTSLHSPWSRRSSSSSASSRPTARRASTSVPSTGSNSCPLDPVQGGPPARGAQQFRPRLRAGHPAGGTAGQHPHQGADEGGVQDGVVEVGAHVGEPELQRRQVVGGPDVPVQMGAVGDDARGGQAGDDLGEPLGRAQVLGRSGRRPPCPPQGAVALVAGVHPVVERRAPGHREQHRQVRPGPVHDGDGGVEVGHPHVHVAAADVLLDGQAGPPFEHRLVPRRGRDRLLPPAAERMRRRGQDGDAGQRRRGARIGAGGDQLGAQLGQRRAHAADGLQLRGHDLGVDPGTEIVAHHRGGEVSTRRELEGDRVDEVVLLLDPERRADGSRPKGDQRVRRAGRPGRFARARPLSSACCSPGRTGGPGLQGTLHARSCARRRRWKAAGYPGRGVD